MNTFGHALSASIPAGSTTWRISAFFLVMMLALSGCLQQEETMMNGAGSVGLDDVAADDGEDVSMTGELTVLYLDDFENKHAELQYFILDKQSKGKYKLKFKDTPPGHLRTGMEVKVRGKAKGKEIFLAADGVDSPSGDSAQSAPAVAGEQKTIVMVADFLDASVSCSDAAIRNKMFTDSANNSVDDLFRETSLGQVSFVGDVVGRYTINYRSTDACDVNGWAAAAEAAAQNNGVDLSQYSRKVYVLPENNTCGWSGLGSVGGGPSYAWVLRCDIDAVFAHELGHNMGMNHASTSTAEYGDSSDIMGSAMSGLRQINGAHQVQMGWRSASMITEATQSGTYDIAPLELGAAQALAPQILKILKSDTGEHYYLSYRQPIGFDNNLSATLTERLHVHGYNGNGGRTTFLSGLLEGATFVDDVNGITLTHISSNPDYLTVQIQLDGSNLPPTCTAAAPIVTLSPTDQSGNPGVTLSYSLSVTNQDSDACAASSFALDSAVPSGWIGNVSPGSLSLGPGQTGTATLMVASAAASTAGTYGVSVTTMDSNEAAHAATGNASYAVVGGCATAAPSMTVAPASQNGNPGVTRVYTVSLVNNDSAACSASAFDLATGSLPSGWSASLSASTLSLAPGSSGTANLSVTSATTAAPDSYSLQVAAADAQEATHAMSQGIVYVVNDTAPTADVEPPTTPAGLAANANSRRVNLSWVTSNDNVGVAGYRVYRDGVLIATTVDPVYADRGGASGVTYAYTVAAYDAANNASAMSAPVMASKGRPGKGKRPRK